MADRSLVVGGTPGALEVSTTLADYLSITFSFDEVTGRRLLDLCPPSVDWTERQRPLVEMGGFPSLDAAVLSIIEACGARFLRTKLKPISKPDQRAYVQAIEAHSDALKTLFTSVVTFDHTVADPFRFLAEASQSVGDQRSRRDHWIDALRLLTQLSLFAKYQLQQDLEPAPGDVREKVRRKNQFPRVVLVADLLSAYQRITGQEPTAYISGDGRVSPAIEFVRLSANAIIKAARLTAQRPMEDETVRKEIAAVKRLWEDGTHPEHAYTLQTW